MTPDDALNANRLLSLLRSAGLTVPLRRLGLRSPIASAVATRLSPASKFPLQNLWVVAVITWPVMLTQGVTRLPRSYNSRGEAGQQKQIPEQLCAERASRMLDDLVSGTEFELMSGWHCLRHSFISLCVAKGIDWPQIAEWVGHVNQKTTKLCTHFNTADSRRKMEALEIRFA